MMACPDKKHSIASTSSYIVLAKCIYRCVYRRVYKVVKRIFAGAYLSARRDSVYPGLDTSGVLQD